MLLADWVRSRRQSVIMRQIALTDALDGRLGAVVAPVVTKPLFGLWEVRIAVPLLGSAMLARIISVTHEVFSGVKGKHPSSYRMILSIKPDSVHTVPERRVLRSAKRWAGTPVAAA
jgi:hypothetical protein